LGAAGLSIAVSRRGKVIHSRGYGLAEVEHAVKADENSMIRVGSITKQFSPPRRSCGWSSRARSGSTTRSRGVCASVFRADESRANEPALC